MQFASRTTAKDKVDDVFNMSDFSWMESRCSFLAGYWNCGETVLGSDTVTLTSDTPFVESIHRRRLASFTKKS